MGTWCSQSQIKFVSQLTQRLVAASLAGVCVQPPALGLGEDLDPHVVRPVERPARVEAERAAAQREGVGPLAAPPAPRLQQLGRPRVVSREAHLRRALGADVTAEREGGIGR